LTKARAALGETVATMVVIALAVGTGLLLAPEPGPAVLGGMLALTLSRSQLERDVRGRIEAGIAMPLVGLAAAGIGALLLIAPIAGAALYVLGMTAGVWLRRLGPTWRGLGGLVMLPFTALLVAPASVPASGPLAAPAVAWLVPVIVPLAAFAWVTLVQLAARRIGLLPAIPAPTTAPVPPPVAERAAAELRRLNERRRALQPSDRAAIHLGVSLVLGFAAGFLLFADHWTWTVLTVVVVLAGAAGRGDAMLKGVSRLIGAALGSAFVVGASGLAGAFGAAALPAGWRIGIIGAALTAGIFARRYAYVWWALCLTVVLALVQSFGSAADGAGGGFLLWERLLEILVGAGLAIAVAWFVVPIPATNVVRKRMAELRDAAAPGGEGRRDAAALAVARTRLAAAAEPFFVAERLHVLPPRHRELAARARALAFPRKD